MSDPHDMAVTRRMGEGDLEAFGELYDRFADSLHRAAQRMAGNRHDADDLLQQLFVDLARYRHRLSSVEDVKGYLFTCLRRLAGAQRRRRREPAIGACDERHSPAADHVGRVASRDAIQVALERLPERQREVVILKVEGGLTFGEIGGVLGISPHTVASRYRYALNKLRRYLGASELGTPSAGTSREQ